jgi:DNA uptake protein ComE-like DNA-binding protein
MAWIGLGPEPEPEGPAGEPDEGQEEQPVRMSPDEAEASAGQPPPRDVPGSPATEEWLLPGTEPTAAPAEADEAEDEDAGPVEPPHPAPEVAEEPRLAEADEVEERPSEADEVDERPSEAIDVEESRPPEPIDVEERIRLAAASAAEAAERRAMDEITALEEEIEQIREEAAARVGELESRLEGATAKVGELEAQLAEMEGRTREAESRAAKVERQREEAQESHRAREEDLVRSKVALEAELAAARRDAEEARERVVAAEREAPAPQVVAADEGEEEWEDEEAEAEAEEGAEEWEAEGEEEEEGEEDLVAPGAGVVRLSEASFEDLRSLGMSITQAKRVLDYRERLDGFDSVDDLDFVPGFPKAFLSQLKQTLTL